MTNRKDWHPWNRPTDPSQTPGYLHVLFIFPRSAHGQTMSPDDDNDDGGFGYEKFVECIKKIVAISDGIRDGWQVQTKEVIFVFPLDKKWRRCVKNRSPNLNKPPLCLNLINYHGRDKTFISCTVKMKFSFCRTFHVHFLIKFFTYLGNCSALL